VLSPAEQFKHREFVKNCETRFDVKKGLLPARALSTLCDSKDFVSAADKVACKARFHVKAVRDARKAGAVDKFCSDIFLWFSDKYGKYCYPNQCAKAACAPTCEWLAKNKKIQAKVAVQAKKNKAHGAVKDKLKKLVKAKDELKGERAKVGKTVEQKEQVIEAAKSKKAAAESTVAGLSKKSQSLSARVEAATQAYVKFEKSVRSNDAEYEKLRKSFESARDAAVKKEAEMKATLKKLADDEQRLKGMMMKLDAGDDGIGILERAVENDVAKLKGRAAARMKPAAKARLQAALKKSQAKLEEVLAKSEKLEQQIDELGYAIEEGYGRTEPMEMEVKMAKKKVPALKKAYEDARKDRETAEKKLKVELGKKQKFDKQLNVANQQVKAMQQAVEALSKTSAKVKADFESWRTKFAAFRGKIQKRREVIEKLKSELSKRFAEAEKVARLAKEHDKTKTSIVKKNPNMTAK